MGARPRQTLTVGWQPTHKIYRATKLPWRLRAMALTARLYLRVFRFKMSGLKSSAKRAISV